jgi:hypothetical protein
LETLVFREKHSYLNARTGIEVPVSLMAGAGRTVRLLAKVDSGAAFCIFQREYADQLGFEVENGVLQTVSTANRSFETYGHTVTLTCFDWTFETVVYFARAEEIHRNVVGRVGWLEHFRIGIVDHESFLLLSQYDE